MGMMVNASLFEEGGPGGMLNLVTDFASELWDWNLYQVSAATSSSLFIPAGTYDSTGPDLAGPRGQLSFVGPGTQTIIGENATTTFVDNLTKPFSKNPYTGEGGNAENGHLPKIDTILVGENVATLKVLAEVSLFSVGQWVQLLAYDMQANGYPQNNHFQEYRQITDINVLTGEITLDQGVRSDYKDTFPQLSGGDINHPDQCGPATLMPMNGTDYWNYHATAKNLTINPTSTFAIYSEGRHITWENCHFVHYGQIPSLSHEVNYVNCTFEAFAGFEFDKLVDLVTYDNCVCDDIITIQSSSIYELQMTNCTVFSMSGTAVHTTLTDCTFNSLRIGTQAYGGARSLVMDNCICNTYFDALHKMFIGPSTASWTNIGGGQFTITFNDAYNSDTFIRLIPDPNLWYFPSHPSYGMYGPAFQCTDVTISGGIFTYSTTLSATDPRLALTSAWFLAAMASVTVTNSEDQLEDPGFLSYPAAAGLAPGEYFNTGPWPDGAAYYLDPPFSVPSISGMRTCNRSVNNGWKLFGKVVSLIFTVTKAYTGVAAGPLLVSIFGDFAGGFRCAQADLTTFGFWSPYFDLKSLGTRTITPSGVTGAQAGDSSFGALALGSNVWFCSQNGISYRVSSDISSESPSVWPEFEFELILDQEIS